MRATGLCIVVGEHSTYGRMRSELRHAGWRVLGTSAPGELRQVAALGRPTVVIVRASCAEAAALAATLRDDPLTADVDLVRLGSDPAPGYDGRLDEEHPPGALLALLDQLLEARAHRRST